ncbi:MAG: SdrD B-like domain-containing protein, partial [Cyanobacteria bacterium P01_C01_bin.38]
MKSLFKNIIVPKSHKLAVGASLSIAIAIATTSPANAQVGVSSLDATYEKGTSSSYSTTVGSPCSYSGGCDSNIDMQFGVGDTNDLVLSGFTTGGNNYSLVELADNVGFRRNNDKGATGERQLVFFEYKNNKEIRSSYTNTMAEAMLGNIINRGVDNGFSNDNGIASNNIERIDYIITGGLSAPDAALDNIGFLVLERGGNDPFQIAAITSLDANGKPNAFGPLISVKKSTWGKSSFSVRTTVMRREENEPRFRPSHQIGNQTISGVYTSINSLGVNPGQTIYGYALFPNDINSSNDLVGLSDFPTRTSGSSGQGGLDLMAGGGIFMRDGLTSVSGTLYEDTDGDNNLNSNEAKLPENITVRLLDNNNNEVATATTDSNGDYQFIGVANGNYKIQVDTTDADIPDGYTLGTANDLEITVAGAAVTEQNFGFDPAKASYTVSGTLYEDSDGEDDFDTSEPRLPEDITVTLYNDANDNNIIDDGEEIATTVTDDNGDYIFTDVADGSYKIKVDTDDDEIPGDNTLGTPNDLEITVAGAAVTNQNFGFDKFTNRPLGSPFTCDSTFYITIGPGGGRDQQLFDVDRSGETFTFNTIGPATNTAGGYPV